jgi:hypothetical protein
MDFHGAMLWCYQPELDQLNLFSFHKQACDVCMHHELWISNVEGGYLQLDNHTILDPPCLVICYLLLQIREAPSEELRNWDRSNRVCTNTKQPFLHNNWTLFSECEWRLADPSADAAISCRSMFSSSDLRSTWSFCTTPPPRPYYLLRHQAALHC